VTSSRFPTRGFVVALLSIVVALGGWLALVAYAAGAQRPVTLPASLAAGAVSVTAAIGGLVQAHSAPYSTAAGVVATIAALGLLVGSALAVVSLVVTIRA
jgi:hypothetical protein